MGGQTKHPRLRDWLLVDLLWFVKGQQIMVSLSRVVMFCSQQLIALLLSRLSDTGVFYRQRVQAGLRQSRDPRPKTWQDVHIHHNVLHIVSQTLPDPAVYLGLLDHSIEILVTHHDLAHRGLSFIARPALWIHVHHVVSTTYLVRIVLEVHIAVYRSCSYRRLQSGSFTVYYATFRAQINGNTTAIHVEPSLKSNYKCIITY